jgi:hypothetical protein
LNKEKELHIQYKKDRNLKIEFKKAFENGQGLEFIEATSELKALKLQIDLE